MFTVRRLLSRMRRDERGFTALEYTLITVVIGTVVMAGTGTIGAALSTSYGTIGTILIAHSAGM